MFGKSDDSPSTCIAVEKNADRWMISLLCDQVLTVMEEDVIIAQQAKLMGISVSDEELNKAMEGFFQYYPEGTPTPTEEVTREPIPTSTLSPTQKALSQRPTEIPTEEPTLSPTPEVTETAEPTATTVAATQPPAETPAATNTPYPTATPYTQEGFETAQKNYYQTLSELKVTEADVRATLKAQLLREKVYDEVTKDVGYLQPMVWARHILVETKRSKCCSGSLEAWCKLVHLAASCPLIRAIATMAATWAGLPAMIW